MNWQTKLSHHIVNGVNGYVPKHRMILQSTLHNFKSPDSLKKLKNMGVEMILVHKNLFKGPREKEYFSFKALRGTKILENKKTHM
ncbi:MAG: hypothetical protein VXW15_14055, partial [Bdellovibrionota bacterium]|nr:hypothetical protein [Bdellovibrionota bacterium]